MSKQQIGFVSDGFSVEGPTMDTSVAKKFAQLRWLITKQERAINHLWTVVGCMFVVLIVLILLSQRNRALT